VAPHGGDFAYSHLAMQGIKDGKIDVVKVDGIVFSVDTQQAGNADRITGNPAKSFPATSISTRRVHV
jgi:hypothetical protein